MKAKNSTPTGGKADGRKTSGDWFGDTRWGDPDAPDRDDRFFVLVDFPKTKSGEILPTRFFIVPEHIVLRNIHRIHQEYLGLHGGVRPGNPDATHHAIRERDYAEWEDRWDLITGEDA